MKKIIVSVMTLIIFLTFVSVPVGYTGSFDVTMYAPDGRTITIFKSEVPAYKNVGWYETQSAAQAAKQQSSGNVGIQSGSSVNQGKTVYVGETGTKYHYQGCRTLKNGGRAISLEAALAEGRTACKVCH